MIIIIRDTEAWEQEELIGVKFRFDLSHGGYVVYEVINEPLFMLAVIKYCIKFEEI
jgi:hypothetical protein